MDFYGAEIEKGDLTASTMDPSMPRLEKTNSIYASHIGDTKSFLASNQHKKGGKKKDCVIM